MDTLPTIRARAPLRLGLAGGGTDVSPYCDEHGGYVLNATIDRYAYAVISPVGRDPAATSAPGLRFVAADLRQQIDLPLDDPLEPVGELALHKATYRAISDGWLEGRRVPLALTTFCDAPAGSGLGSSSTLVVAMVRALAELFNLPLDDYTIAQLAWRIERVDCGLGGGRQDQYSATFGGFNFMEFFAGERTIVNPLRVKNWILCELEASLVLFYTGVSRDSARIIADQSSGVANKSVQAIEAMHGLKREALVMKECVLKGDFEGIVQSMRLGWQSKKASAASVSNPHINSIYDAALAAGARAGKVSGAGGGGFMMFFVPAERRMDVIRALQGFEGVISNCHFTKSGTQAWRL